MVCLTSPRQSENSGPGLSQSLAILHDELGRVGLESQRRAAGQPGGGTGWQS